MNILFCGDRYIEDGLIIAVTSLLKNTDDVLHIYILTMDISTSTDHYHPISSHMAEYMDSYVKEKDPANSVTLLDITRLYSSELPLANMNTRFTPYCMLRLFSDRLDEIPDRILYLDVDVICRRDLREFYYQDLDGYEFAAVLDHYGKWFFRRNIFHFDYINSGVMLLNMKMIRQTGLFTKCRQMCRTKKMFMPDQSAINKLAQSKKFCPVRYNEQKRLRRKTVIHHFTTEFRYIPVPHILTIKPWEIERVHSELKIHEYDDILRQYKKIKSEIER